MVDNTLARVIESIASTTRYPIQLLTAEADLENDLGIDSVKRLEIVLALGDEFQLPLDREPRDASIRTIEDVSQWVTEMMRRQGSAPLPRFDPPSSARIPTPASSSVSAVHQPRVAAVNISPESRYPAALNTEPLQAEVASSRSARIATAAAAGGYSATFDAPFSNGQEVPAPRTAMSPVQAERLAPAAGLPSATSELPLRGKVALVTGSGRGVGQTIARYLASRGATVIVNSFHSRELGERTTLDINSSGGAAIHLWGSVANPQHVEQMFREITSRFGRLDILICNASDGRIGSFLELDSEDWDRAFRTNVVGHHQCAVHASGLMRSHGGGSIITMSAVGSHGYIEGLGSQGVVKAAVETMTRYLACELGRYGIRVNCVVGGPVYGELLSKFPNARTTQQHWESMTPDGTLCGPMDLANAIGFLVSDEAGGVNGSIWNVDHGFSATADGRPLRYSAQLQV